MYDHIILLRPYLESHPLPGVVLGRGGPHQERAHVLSQLQKRGNIQTPLTHPVVLSAPHLALGGGGSVLILNDLVVERRRHADGAAQEVRVEVLALAELNAGGSVAVSARQMGRFGFQCWVKFKRSIRWKNLLKAMFESDDSTHPLSRW